MKSIYTKQFNLHMCLKKECIYEGSTLQYIFTKCWKTLETKSLLCVPNTKYFHSLMCKIYSHEIIK